MAIYFRKISTICGLAFGQNFLKLSVSDFVFPPQKIFGERCGWYVGWIHWMEIYFVNIPHIIHPSDGFKIAVLPMEYWLLE